MRRFIVEVEERTVVVGEEMRLGLQCHVGGAQTGSTQEDIVLL